jgi:hypothetical protein
MAVPSVPELTFSYQKLEMRPKQHGWVRLLRGSMERGLAETEIAQKEIEGARARGSG